MNNQDKIKAIQAVLSHPGNESVYYDLLEQLGDLKVNYSDYMVTEPINCNEELQRVPTYRKEHRNSAISRCFWAFNYIYACIKDCVLIDWADGTGGFIV